VRLWIDTDVGDNPDDAVALVAASAHPAVDLVGVSTTGRRTAWRAGLAAELVDALIVAGERPDELIGAFRRAAPDALLAIGPLTNIAGLVALGVGLPAITVMGGALAPVRHRGRLQTAEHNFAADPGAAEVVVARTDALIVPLDVTAALRLTDEQVDELARRNPRLLPELTRWRARYDDPVVVHDALALLACVDDPIVTTARVTLSVDARDGTLRASEAGREHAVVVAVDVSAAVDRVLALVG
jgi:inosine-uridine nucleoside N-ribohydrolase